MYAKTSLHASATYRGRTARTTATCTVSPSGSLSTRSCNRRSSTHSPAPWQHASLPPCCLGWTALSHRSPSPRRERDRTAGRRKVDGYDRSTTEALSIVIGAYWSFLRSLGALWLNPVRRRWLTTSLKRSGVARWPAPGYQAPPNCARLHIYSLRALVWRNVGRGAYIYTNY